jgi:hypothetical protein
MRRNILIILANIAKPIHCIVYKLFKVFFYLQLSLTIYFRVKNVGVIVKSDSTTPILSSASQL